MLNPAGYILNYIEGTKRINSSLQSIEKNIKDYRFEEINDKLKKMHNDCDDLIRRYNNVKHILGNIVAMVEKITGKSFDINNVDNTLPALTNFYNNLKGIVPMYIIRQSTLYDPGVDISIVRSVDGKIIVTYVPNIILDDAVRIVFGVDKSVLVYFPFSYPYGNHTYTVDDADIEDILTGLFVHFLHKKETVNNTYYEDTFYRYDIKRVDDPEDPSDATIIATTLNNNEYTIFSEQPLYIIESKEKLPGKKFAYDVSGLFNNGKSITIHSSFILFNYSTITSKISNASDYMRNIIVQNTANFIEIIQPNSIINGYYRFITGMTFRFNKYTILDLYMNNFNNLLILHEIPFTIW